VPAICVGGFVTFVLAGFLGFLAGHSAGGFEVSFGNLMILAVMGPLQLSVPLIFYARGAKSVAAVTLSLIVMLDAVINPLWPLLFLGELPDPAAFTGGAIIIGAVLISIFGVSAMKRVSAGLKLLFRRGGRQPSQPYC
jgi:drug/metabolite transporter (DMT)-like permease